VNLRSGPGTAHSIVGRVYNGDVLTIDTNQCRDEFGLLRCDESGQWVFVQTVDRLKSIIKDQKGWINSHYVMAIACTDE
jgi:uncharacterized repeat protein (TIGR04076 family)